MKNSKYGKKTSPAEPKTSVAGADSERLQKVMAGTGMGSRRALEKQIAEGVVLVNGKKAELGRSVKADDTIHFRDREWLVVAESSQQQRTLIYNKPEGELTTRSDPQGRPTVFDKMPWLKDARWVAVGRLDINTTGLLLLTTDGELANAMMHPSSQVDREYVCRIRGEVSDEQLENLRQGVELDDGPASFSDIKRMPGTSGNQWFQVTILEGRNREVRRLWESQGCMVSRLKRVRYGAARLPRGLKVGHWSEITPRDHRVLRLDVKLKPAVTQLTLQETKNRSHTGKKRSNRRGARPASGPRVGTPRASTPRSSDTRPHHPGAKPSAKPGARSAARPGTKSRAKPGAKPGSPAGPGRRPHPRSRKATDR